MKTMKNEKDKVIKELEEEGRKTNKKMEGEVGKLEEIILEQKGRAANEALDLQKQSEEAVMKVEGKYETRLSIEASRYQNLKDVFDDLTTAAIDERSVMSGREEEAVRAVREEWDRDRAALLAEHVELKAYAKYVQERFKEVLRDNDLAHDGEVTKIVEGGKGEIERLRGKVKKSQGETSLMQRQNKVLRDAVESRNLTNFELKEEVEVEKRKAEGFKDDARRLRERVEKEKGRADKWEEECGSRARQVRGSEGSERREMPNIVLNDERNPLLVSSLLA